MLEDGHHEPSEEYSPPMGCPSASSGAGSEPTAGGVLCADEEALDTKRVVASSVSRPMEAAARM